MGAIIYYSQSESGSSLHSTFSNDSAYAKSHSTAPTSYDPNSRPALSRYGSGSSCGDDVETSPNCTYDPRASTDTYASTIASSDDLDGEPEYQVPEYREESESDPLPCTPPEFSELFPSTRKLCIRHDDTTIDGNMNLRIDTEVAARDGPKTVFTLFHLRMQDLRTRNFSLRRYCRDSGREVCHTSRKTYSRPTERPILQKSVSYALASFRGKSSSKHSVKSLSESRLKRSDSGYDSISENDDDAESKEDESKTKLSVPSNTMKLEFSNYAHVDLKRRGTKSSKRYEFSYWGTSYTWKRVVRREAHSVTTSFHLVNNKNGVVAAHIVPVPLTPAQAEEETAKGGWIPPCSMWISEEGLLGGDAAKDVADVIVSSGLSALVDDCIKSRFHSKRSVQIMLPVTKSLKMEYVGPKKLIDEVFHRRHSTSSPRGHHSPSSPVRQTTAPV